MFALGADVRTHGNIDSCGCHNRKNWVPAFSPAPSLPKLQSMDPVELL